MKKLISIILALSLLFIFVACHEPEPIADITTEHTTTTPDFTTKRTIATETPKTTTLTEPITATQPATIITKPTTPIELPATTSGMSVFGNWETAPFWNISVIVVERIEYGTRPWAGNTERWWVNGHLEVSKDRAELLTIGETYEVKILHGTASNTITAARTIQFW